MNHDNTNDPPRRKLSDILNGGTDSLRDQWNRTEAADDFAPLPAGTYEAHVESVALFNAKSGTPGVKVTFKVCEGKHVGRFVWHDCWLTPAALPQTKRDCQKLGLNTVEQLETASVEPGRIRCKVNVALRKEDDGTTFNRVRRFNVLGIDDPPSVEDDDFAPKPTDDGPDTTEAADVTADDCDSALIDMTPEHGKEGLPDA